MGPGMHIKKFTAGETTYVIEEQYEPPKMPSVECIHIRWLVTPAEELL